MNVKVLPSNGQFYKDFKAIEMSLNNYSTEDLVRDLEKRKELKNIKPPIIDNPDWSNVINLAEEITESIFRRNYHEENDDADFMYEAVMRALYGLNYFEWVNKLIR